MESLGLAAEKNPGPPGTVLSRQKARKPPTNISVDSRTVRI